MLTKSLKNNSNLAQTCSFQIKINDSCFQRITCAKYLGVLIDSSLDWSSHVQYIKSKLDRSSYLQFSMKFEMWYQLMFQKCYILVLHTVI